MIDTNKAIINFVINNYLLIIVLLVSILRVIPPEWAGFWKHKDDDASKDRALRITILNFVFTNLFDSVVRAFFIPLLATIGLKSTVTLVILMVVCFDIFVRKLISGPAVTLVCVGIIALYLENLIENGHALKLFGGFLSWDRKREIPKVQEDSNT